MKPIEIQGFVLAGGKSSRMGRDKALLDLNGQPLLMRAAQLVESTIGKAPTIIGAKRKTEECAGLVFVEDEWLNAGPLSGIVTALGTASGGWSLIIACDMPYLSGPWLEFLMDRATGSDADVVLPANFNGLEPLCAMYHKRCEGVLRGAFEKGTRKVTEALRALRLDRIEPAEWQAFDASGGLFKNVNSPADYEEAKRRLG